jgi:uncharacterized membrane protein HdeD (DUF308 family)
MLTKLFHNWWLFGVRGVVAIIFGIMALVWPESMKVALVLLFGAFVLIDGCFAVATSIATRKYFERWWALLLEGLVGIVIGLMAFFQTDITALVLLYYIAAWAILTGIFEIVAAIQFRHVIPGEWTYILNGIFSVILGILLFVFPDTGLVSLVWAIGIYAIIDGILEIVLAFRMHSLLKDLDKTVEAGA